MEERVAKDLITVVIPTYNSEGTLSPVLKAIRKQSYPKKQIEILIVDGGSTDKTVNIANKFECKILKNPKKLQVFAKQLGTLKAKGRYIVHLDSDEVMVSRKSLEKKIELFRTDKRIKAIVPSGLVTPKKVSSANYISNEFGDPFSYFMYRVSINFDFFIPILRKISRAEYENKNGVIFDFSETDVLPPIELSAIGIALDRNWVLKSLPKLKKDPALVSQTFYSLVKDKALLGVTKNDKILHYSASSWKAYLKKIRSRIINNVYKTEMGKSAFSGRTRYYPSFFRIKKYLFIPYSLSIIFPIADSLYLVISRRNMVFLSYPILCLFISSLTFYYTLIKALGVKPQMKGWGI